MKFKVGDKVRWSDSTLGTCKGIVSRLGGEALPSDRVLFEVRVTSSTLMSYDSDSDDYPVYASDRPERNNGRYQRVDAGPSWGLGVPVGAAK